MVPAANLSAFRSNCPVRSDSAELALSAASLMIEILLMDE
jgi:hypothetical protein